MGGTFAPMLRKEKIASANAAWAKSFGLVSDDLSIARLAAIRCASCAAHTYANAPEAVVQLGADLITWLFLFDNRYGEGAADDDVSSLRVRCARLRTHAEERGGALGCHGVSSSAPRHSEACSR